MGFIEKKIKSTDHWIFEKTSGSKSVVELGAGFFNRLRSVNSCVVQRIGIEISEKYVMNTKFNDCVKIVGDATKYSELLPNNCYYDTVMLIDFLEHLDMDSGKILISNLKVDFKKILLMIPCGLYNQKEDVTGFGEHEFQTHKSFWYESDILDLNFQENLLDKNYHINNSLAQHDKACAFCTWTNIY